MNTKFYEFNQNNSGGSFVVDENVCHRVVIEAHSESEAIAKAESLGCYWNGCDEGMDCSCCGDRWYASPSEINISEWKEKGYRVNVYSHYKDAEERWFNLYGEFPRIEEPAWGKNTVGSKEFRGKIYFDSIEQYCQFMANAYGWTVHDVRIHYLDGTKKEIFKSQN